MNKIKSLLFVLPFLFLVSLSCFVTPTLCATNDQDLEIKSVCVVENENNLFQPDNFTALAGCQLKYEVLSESNLTAKNFDGLTITTNQIGSQNYEVLVQSNNAVQTQIIFQNEKSNAFVNVNFIENTINSLEIKAPIHIAKNQDNEFNLIVNNNENLFNNQNVNYSLLYNQQETSLTDSHEFVKSLNKNKITLNFSSLVNFDGKFTLKAQIGEKVATKEFIIKDYPLSDEFMLLNKKIVYILGSNNVVANVKLKKDCYANFKLYDNYAKIKNIAKTTKGNYDEYALTLDITNFKSNQIIVSNLTTNGEILRGINFDIIDSISSFKIETTKTNYKPNEDITINATVNGNEQLSADIEWYVSGNLIGTGSQITFSRAKGGNINVIAKIGEIESNSLTLTIAYQENELIGWYILFIVVLVMFILFIIFKKKKRNFYVSSNLISRTKKIMPRFNELFNKYNKRQFKNLIIDVSTLKEDTNQNYKDTKNLLFERAFRELSTALTALRKIYATEKDDHLGAFIENAPKFENCIKEALSCFEEFNQLYPNEKMFTLNKKDKKQEKKKS